MIHLSCGISVIKRFLIIDWFHVVILQKK